MNSAYSMYGGHLTITILYIMTQWSLLSQTVAYESESISSTGIHLTENYICMYTVTYLHMKVKARVQYISLQQ